MNSTLRLVGASIAGVCALSVVAMGGGLSAADEATYQGLLGRPLHTWTHNELATFLDFHRRRGTDPPSPGDDVALFAHQSIGQPFNGRAGLFQLTAGNCVTLTERCLALACAADWEAHYKLTLRLRHKQGEPAFLERNFFMLLDWLPNNRWLIDDVTCDMGVAVTAFDFVAYPKRFYATLEFGQDQTPAGQAKAAAKAAKIASLPEKVARSEEFVGVDVLESAYPKIRNGDVWLLVRERSAPGLKPWYDSDHMGVFYKPTPDRVTLIHSSPPGVQEETLAEFRAKRPWVRGFKILRLRSQARVLAEQEITRLAETVPAYAAKYDPSGPIAFADAPLAATTQPACSLKAGVSISGSGCCIMPPTECAGLVLYTYDRNCGGTCGDGLRCASTKETEMVVSRLVTCNGHCDGLPVSCISYIILEGVGKEPSKCECVKSADAP